MNDSSVCIVEPNNNNLPVVALVRKSIAPIGGFLDRLGEIMKDQRVRAFFDDYFSTWTDAKTALMFMQAYVSIDEAYAAQSGGERLGNEQILVIVREMMANSECRRMLMEAMKQYTGESNAKFLDAYRQMYVAHKQLEATSKDSAVIKLVSDARV